MHTDPTTPVPTPPGPARTGDRPSTEPRAEVPGQRGASTGVGQAVDTEVLVVGAGPTGLTAALALARSGIEVHVITRYRWLSNSPRAHITNQRAMEVLRDLGVEPDVLALGAPWEHMGDTLLTTSFAGEEVARIRSWGTGDAEHGRYVAASPSPMVDLPQPELEACILRQAGEAGAAIRFSTEYLGHEQAGDHVRVRLRDRLGGTEAVLTCRYLVAADGARSRVVQAEGLPMAGTMGRASTRYVRFRADLRHLAAHRPSILYWVVTPGGAFGEIGLGLLRSVHQWDEWIAGWGYDPDVPGAEEDLPEAEARARIRELVGEDVEVELLGQSVWHVNEAWATEYRSGRVLAGGDAVHRHPPSGGLGSNTCVQDAFNLGWKLAYVLRGWAGEGLLDSYSAERVPVGRQIVTRANASRRDYEEVRRALRFDLGVDAASVLERVSAPTPEGTAVRDALARALAVKQHEFNAHGVELGQRYVSGAVVPDGTPDEDWSGIDPELIAQPTTRPGAKLPHAWLVGADGRRVSTLDLVGRGRFTLVTGRAGTAWVEAVTALDLPFLDALVVDSPGARDLYRSWHAVREIEEAGAILVRPDGYVAWRHRTPVDEAATAEELLGRAVDTVLDRPRKRPSPRTPDRRPEGISSRP